MRFRNVFSFTSIFLVIFLLLSQITSAEEIWAEYTFSEDLKPGDEIIWEYEKLSYSGDYYNSLVINETEGDVLKFEILHNPNDVIHFAVLNYYFDPLPYEVTLNDKLITILDLYFAPFWGNYSTYISPIYFNSSFYGSYYVFEEKLAEWEEQEHDYSWHHQEYNSSYLDQAYFLEYDYFTGEYCSITEEIYTFNLTNHMIGEFYFYNSTSTIPIYTHESYEMKYNIETGILLSYDRYRNDSMIVFYPDYIEYEPQEYKFIILLTNSDQERGIITLNNELFLPFLITSILILKIIKRKKK